MTIARAWVRSAEAFEPAVTAAREANVDCLYVVVPQAEASPLGAGIRGGGVLTAIRLVLEHRGDHPVRQPTSVRRATPRDTQRLVELSAALARFSRFAADPHFPRERIAEMYRIWALNDLRVGDVFVADDGESGMLTLARHEDGFAIDHIYVDDAARGTGLGHALVDAAVARAGGRTLTIATDVRNLPAVRLFESAGFRARSLDALLHVWVGGANRLPAHGESGSTASHAAEESSACRFIGPGR
jgi:ribosomal protein S18 acetylase RimI-like enzyme